MSLKGKRILITAGPTWIAIDRVRVISNLATGKTGFILADKFKKLGFKVTLLIGPVDFHSSLTGVRIIRFKYFTELAALLKKELSSKKYAAIIHAAAVADYRPREVVQRKFSSLRKCWRVNLVPTKKLVNRFKKYSGLFTVGFKFEPDADKNQLIKKGQKLLKSAALDLVVANSNKKNTYRAYIMDKLNNNYGPFFNKIKMAGCLSKLTNKQL
ncbi:MAG: hypothetical protein NT014_05955 [Candidatus Omnitrophica bacterium]|nr:hypothetical protein [Candidatus Omnitrophota bacterium]